MAKLARLSVLERSFREAVEAEKIAAMAEFAAGAGHEINNPLAVIAGRAQLLLRDEADPERRRDLALMNAQAMRRTRDDRRPAVVCQSARIGTANRSI